MYVTFRNNSTSEKMIVTVEKQRHIIPPETSMDVFCGSSTVIFEAQTSSFDELKGMIGELDEEMTSYKLKDNEEKN